MTITITRSCPTSAPRSARRGSASATERGGYGAMRARRRPQRSRSSTRDAAEVRAGTQRLPRRRACAGYEVAGRRSRRARSWGARLSSPTPNFAARLKTTQAPQRPQFTSLP